MPEHETLDAQAAIDRISGAAQSIRDQLSRIIVGQQEAIDLLLVSLLCRGHCMLEGVPGLAKTLMISTLAQSLNLSFSRIQFTPDLMPADITGTDVIEENKTTGQREIRFLAGPIFSHVILADEINRTPPKTQAALLEAMQERQVTVGRVRHTIGAPFFVLATQNPIEQEGTYPLPEAQQDRFMLKVLIQYPQFDEEMEIARRTTSGAAANVQPVLSPEEICELQEIVLSVPISEHLLRYAVAIVRATRVDQPEALEYCRQNLSWGAGTRAIQFLVLGAKARALLHGRGHVTVEDVRELSLPVLRHRLVINFAADSEGIKPDDVIAQVLESIPSREDELTRDPRFRQMLAS